MIDLQKGDCLELMKNIKDKSIDMIFCDLPYGTTKCKWDSIIPLNKHLLIRFGNYKKDKITYKDESILELCKRGLLYEDSINYFNKNALDGLWQHYERIIKDDGAIVLTAQTPFDKVLGCSNLKLLRYEWIWEKTQATGHLNAKKMPMKAHENVLVFYKKLPTYNPQKTTGHKPINSYTKYLKTQNNTEIYGEMKREISGGGETDRYPRSVQVFASDKQRLKLHSTQKPAALCDYFVKTYSNEGDTILDNCMGSGTTGDTCKRLKRNFIGMEKDEVIFNVAVARVDG